MKSFLPITKSTLYRKFNIACLRIGSLYDTYETLNCNKSPVEYSFLFLSPLSSPLSSFLFYIRAPDSGDPTPLSSFLYYVVHFVGCKADKYINLLLRSLCCFRSIALPCWEMCGARFYYMVKVFHKWHTSFLGVLRKGEKTFLFFQNPS